MSYAAIVTGTLRVKDLVVSRHELESAVSLGQNLAKIKPLPDSADDKLMIFPSMGSVKYVYIFFIGISLNNLKTNAISGTSCLYSGAYIVY